LKFAKFDEQKMINKNSKDVSENINKDKKMDKDFISQVIIIIAGFIIAETFVRKIIEGSEGFIAWWILPLLAIMFLVLAFKIKSDRKKGWFYYITYLLFPILIFYIFLKHKGDIDDIVYLIITFLTMDIYFILWIMNIRIDKLNLNRKL
jgi:hypothetical protein